MGRGCTMDEWAHFQKLPEEGRVPNSSYWYVQCLHCLTGFAEKQLFNAPAKLTGRRSAMRAHLKICPMYAPQYRAEQEAAAVAKDRDEAAEAAAPTPPGEKRKRKAAGTESGGGRGKGCMMEEWAHFTRLQEEGYIGKSNFFHAVCKHCQRAYDEAPEAHKPLLVPEKLVGRREKMRKHLSLCPHFKGELPPVVRRLHQRANGIAPSGVFNSLAAGGSVAAAASATTDASTATAPAATNNGSSRLALDEWHYFTRLERKKDSAYYYARCNFCQQAYQKAPENMKTSMEPAIVTGRKSNMQTHLAKCVHVPKDAAAFAKVHGDADADLGGPSSAARGPATNAPSQPKRAKLGVASAPSVPFPDSASVHRALVKLLLEQHLPFDWVGSDGAKQLFRALVPVSAGAADQLLPTPADLRTRILDEIHSATLLSELAKLQELVPLKLRSSAFPNDTAGLLSSPPAGSWPVMLHCNLSGNPQRGLVRVPTIDGVVTNGKAIVSLSFVRDRQAGAAVGAELAHDHGLEVARWLDEHIRLCADTTKLALAAVLLPFNSSTQRAVGILRAPRHWPRFVFLSDVEDLLHFPLLKLLATAELFTAVSSLIEVWQLESIRSCVVERLSEVGDGTPVSPFRDWESCATLIQVLLDEKTFEARTQRGAATAKRLVENALNRALLERVYNLLHAFANAFSKCRAGMTLSDAVAQLGALFAAAEGFVTVQLALEVVWGQLEQPLFVVAHALDPRTRLRAFNSTELTKVSTLSDLSASYFTVLFGRPSNSLRGEVAAYLHTSQVVFTAEFAAEFPDVGDYLRHLSDKCPSLSMLMQALHSFSPVSLSANATTPKGKTKHESLYSGTEQQKLDYLRGRWGIASPSQVPEEGEIKSRIGAHTDRSGAALLNVGVVVDEWKEALESKLHLRGVDFSMLEDKFEGVEDSGVPVVASKHLVAEHSSSTLPSLEQDDELAFPSVPLRPEFSTKVSLKELLKPAEATI